MSRKRCKRKVWNLVNPIQHAIDGAGITTDDVLVELRTRELGAIDAFARGKAGLQEWHDITQMLNVCECMAINGIGIEALDTCQKAQEALKESADRFERTGKMGTTGTGLQAFRDLYEYHDLQRKSIARSEYDKQIKLTRNHLVSKSKRVEVIA